MEKAIQSMSQVMQLRLLKTFLHLGLPLHYLLWLSVEAFQSNVILMVQLMNIWIGSEENVMSLFVTFLNQLANLPLSVLFRILKHLKKL